jgi:predicted acetyltransferase
MSLAVRFHLEDTFVPENSAPFVVNFEQGRPSWVSDGPYDVEVSMDISTFSSLALGVISFGKLAAYGSLSVSSAEYVDILDALFHTDQKPVCTTPF